MKTFALALLTLSVQVAFGAGNAKDGQAVYDRACKNCHGATGEANPNIAKMMKVEIANLGSPSVQKIPRRRNLWVKASVSDASR